MPGEVNSVNAPEMARSDLASPSGRSESPYRTAPRDSLAAAASRFAVRLALSVFLVVITLFPNAPRLAGQFARALHPERLVDPYFPGSDEAVDMLRLEMAALPPDAPFSKRVKAVSSFVKNHVAYASDWDLYGGNLHDWPTPEEVWRRRSDDCDGIAILNASLLRRIGIHATLEYNAFHCWAKAWDSAGDSESSTHTVGRAVDGPTTSRGDGSMDWLRLGQDLFRPRTWTEGLSFPLWRLFVTFAAALSPWILFRQPLRSRPGAVNLARASVFLFSGRKLQKEPNS